MGKKQSILSSGFLAIVFHYLLWKVPPHGATWIGAAAVGWAIGFLIGWKIQPEFVSRHKRYVTSQLGLALNRLAMGAAWGGGLALLLGVIGRGLIK